MSAPNTIDPPGSFDPTNPDTWTDQARKVAAADDAALTYTQAREAARQARIDYGLARAAERRAWRAFLDATTALDDAQSVAVLYGHIDDSQEPL